MSDLAAKLEDLIPRLEGVRVMVVGDFVADRYVFAEPSRLSREAPVVVTLFQEDRLIPGGAANAVRNLHDLGAKVTPVGVVGDGDHGRALLQALDDYCEDTSGVVVDTTFRTVTKTRFLVGEQQRTKQQVFRMDFEPQGPPADEVCETLAETVRQGRGAVDGVIVSDYGYGVVNENLLAVATADGVEPLVTADSRYRIREFEGVALATPNIGELESAVGFPVRSTEELERAGRTLLAFLGSPGLLVTRGNQGMSLFRKDAERVDIEATGVDEVTDVSGAGDTVIAVATLALAAGADLMEAACLANLAAGVVVTKVGPATCSPAELKSALSSFY